MQVSPLARRLAVASTAALLWSPMAGAVAASAASVGGLTTRNLTAITQPAATGAPTVLVWENFDGVTGTPLAGTVTDGGAGTWSVDAAGAAWRIGANRARSTTADSAVVVDAGRSDVTVVGRVFRNGATTFDGGFTVDHGTPGTGFLACRWTSNANGSVELWAYDSGWTLLASATNLYPGGIATAPTSITLGCAATSSTLSATVAGSAVVTATLSAAEQALFGDGTHRGVGPYQATAAGLTWDDVHVDVP